ncbi:sulfurtransferase [Magnetospira sp. QH-2]|uniref:sulfurtransferase n=1 Tax=Magnetospira sp. (strain QH-2) TaxID=1288970 RepID=UPI0003E81602|nr:rhodanese-like domain-containing protein [Magnetospira sp. QH-2]CCQ75082.1 putative exported sulfurtransferase [Magnetospira sp. QH-2]
MRRLILTILLLLASPASADERGALIGPEDLPSMGNILVLEVSAPGISTPMAHIPGAIHTAFAEDGWTMDYPGLPGMLPPTDELAKRVGALGIGADRSVIIVPTTTDDNGYAAATRVFWSLRMLGHAKLYLLDGGLPGYMAGGRTMTDRLPRPHPITYHPTPTKRWRAAIGQVYEGSSAGTPPIDLRPTSGFMGEVTHPLVKQPGTIIEAVSFPPGAFIDPATGQFRPLDYLAHIFEDTLGKPPGTVVLFSNMGYRAAIGWFAVREIMGLKNVRLFDGSMIQWDQEDREIYNPSNDMGGAIG